MQGKLEFKVDGDGVGATLRRSVSKWRVHCLAHCMTLIQEHRRACNKPHLSEMALQASSAQTTSTNFQPGPPFECRPLSRLLHPRLFQSHTGRETSLGGTHNAQHRVRPENRRFGKTALYFVIAETGFSLAVCCIQPPFAFQTILAVDWCVISVCVVCVDCMCVRACAGVGVGGCVCVCACVRVCCGVCMLVVVFLFVCFLGGDVHPWCMRFAVAGVASVR